MSEKLRQQNSKPNVRHENKLEDYVNNDIREDSRSPAKIKHKMKCKFQNK